MNPPPSGNNNLITYLKAILPSAVIGRIIAEYRLASTPDQSIIFLQIDTEGNCRTGKIMQYNPTTGKRIKDPTQPGRISWLHTSLKRRRQLTKDWQLSQCIFGEYLLLANPDKTIALVESEKTAIICSALKGRKIIAFPDIDASHIDLADWLIQYLTDNNYMYELK